MIPVLVTQLSLHTLCQLCVNDWLGKILAASSCHKQVLPFLKLITEQHKASIIIQCSVQVLCELPH